MSRLIRDYLEVGEGGSLGSLVERLTAIRDSLPEGADAMVRMRGDDHFGRHIAIAFNRPLTPEEAECEQRYASAGRPQDVLSIAA